MRGLRRGSLFPGFALFDFRVMVTDDTADGGTRDGMMTCHVSRHRPDGGPFEAAFRLTQAGQQS
jgi:hypothetical protein